MRFGARSHFNQTDERLLEGLIAEIEGRTSAEIRIHVERRCRGNQLDRAAECFEALRMHETDARNGVLLYLAIHDRKFAVIGDVGIHQVVDQPFWDATYEAASPWFKSDAWVVGLKAALEAIGKALEVHFPRSNEDVNELSDTISWGW